MTIADDIYTELTTDVAVGAEIGDRAHRGDLPQTVTLPAITYTRISSTPINDLSGENTTRNSRYQIDCYAISNSAADALGELVKTAMENATAFTSIRIAHVELHDIDALQYRTVQDFSIWY